MTFKPTRTFLVSVAIVIVGGYRSANAYGNINQSKLPIKAPSISAPKITPPKTKPGTSLSKKGATGLAPQSHTVYDETADDPGDGSGGGDEGGGDDGGNNGGDGSDGGDDGNESDSGPVERIVWSTGSAWGDGPWSCPGHQAFSANNQTLTYAHNWTFAITVAVGYDVGFAKASLEATSTHGDTLTDSATGNKGQWVCWWRRNMVTQSNYQIHFEWTDNWGGWHTSNPGGGYINSVTGVEMVNHVSDGYSSCSL